MAEHMIGIDVDDMRLETKEALRAAAELGFSGVQIGTAAGDVTPDALSPSGRRHLRRLLSDLGLSLPSLTADYAGLRWTDSKTVEERVERTCRALDLARELSAPILSAGAGALTHPTSGEPSAIALAALRRVGEFADSRGVALALRPAYDSPERLERVLRELNCPSIRVCVDPAAMVMAGANPLALVERFPDQILLVNARDGTAGGPDRPGEEVRFGEGDVDLSGLFAALRDADYRGAYVVRRTASQSPIPDLCTARDELARFLRS